MMKDYFKDCKTLEQLRKVYRDTFKKNHPDCGGTWNGKDVVAFEAAYTARFEELKKWDTTCTREDATKEEQNRYNPEQDARIREALRRVITIPDINIEIVGCWIWIDGATYTCKDQLKEYGYKWSKSRKKWHFTPYERTKYYKGGKLSFDEIRARYGSEKMEQAPTAAIA